MEMNFHSSAQILSGVRSRINTPATRFAARRQATNSAAFRFTVLLTLALFASVFTPQRSFAAPDAVYGNAQYHLVSTPAQRIDATLTDSFSLPDMSALEWTIYAPDAPETDDQKSVYSSLKVLNRACPVATWSELSPLNRTLFQAKLVDDGARHGAQLDTKATYAALLYRRDLLPGPPTDPVQTLTKDERSMYTRASLTIDYDAPVFQSWLDANALHRMHGERDLDFALRVFESIRRNYVYCYDLEQDRRASAICQVSASDCGGLSQLFVSALRAGGIPATTLCGRLARTSRDAELDHGNVHVKSQFYAEGIGWVPVEISGATYDKSAPFWTYFGRSYGDFLTLSIDNDQKLLAGHYGMQNQRGLQGVRFWVWGAEGSGTRVDTSTSWIVHQLPLETSSSHLASAKN